MIHTGRGGAGNNTVASSVKQGGKPSFNLPSGRELPVRTPKSKAANSKVGAGRGGAGNLQRISEAPPPVLRSYEKTLINEGPALARSKTAGRGGAGNITQYHSVAGDAALRRTSVMEAWRKSNPAKDKRISALAAAATKPTWSGEHDPAWTFVDGPRPQAAQRTNALDTSRGLKIARIFDDAFEDAPPIASRHPSAAYSSQRADYNDWSSNGGPSIANKRTSRRISSTMVHSDMGHSSLASVDTFNFSSAPSDACTMTAASSVNWQSPIAPSFSPSSLSLPFGSPAPSPCMKTTFDVPGYEASPEPEPRLRPEASPPTPSGPRPTTAHKWKLQLRKRLDNLVSFSRTSVVQVERGGQKRKANNVEDVLDRLRNL